MTDEIRLHFEGWEGNVETLSESITSRPLELSAGAGKVVILSHEHFMRLQSLCEDSILDMLRSVLKGVRAGNKARTKFDIDHGILSIHLRAILAGVHVTKKVRRLLDKIAIAAGSRTIDLPTDATVFYSTQPAPFFAKPLSLSLFAKPNTGPDADIVDGDEYLIPIGAGVGIHIPQDRRSMGIKEDIDAILGNLSTRMVHPGKRSE